MKLIKKSQKMIQLHSWRRLELFSFQVKVMAQLGTLVDKSILRAALELWKIKIQKQMDYFK